jgi:large subunit ribosomal protein LP0
VFESGTLYDPVMPKIEDEDMLASVRTAASNAAAFSLAANYPTLASIPHSVINGYKNVLAVSVATDYTFPLAEKVLCFPTQSSVLPSCAPSFLQ